MSSICNPPLIWLNGSCYRKNPYLESSKNEERMYSDTRDQYAVEDDLGTDDQVGFDEGELRLF